METLFYSISIALFVLAILTFVLVVRDAFPLLDSEDRASLRNYWTGKAGFDTWRKRDSAINRAWNKHARSFPKSRKRLLFAAFLIAASDVGDWLPALACIWRTLRAIAILGDLDLVPTSPVSAFTRS